MGKIYTSVEQLIGGTPLLELTRIAKQEGLQATLLAKLEYLNPAGSAKDRVAKAMLDDAEARGLLQPDSVIIEPTSGNTGIGLAVVKEIVDRHGGWVQVEGRKDEGACFTIHIPLYDEGRTPKARQQKPKQTKVPKAAKGKEKQRPKGHR